MVTSNGSDSAGSVGLVDSSNAVISATEESDFSLDNIKGEHRSIVPVRVTCPNLGAKCNKVFQFSLSESVWQCKQMVLIEFSSNPNIQDPLNFGFYLPPHAGRAGKFLDEERKLSEYPMDNIQAHLEFRYKRRIFRHLYVPDEKKLLKVNSKKYRKKFMEFLQSKNIQEMQKMLEKGLDPNFHEERVGDTPLIVASMYDDSMDVLKLLVQFGAYLDFRSLKGKTALHIAAASGKLNVLKNFQNLGASSNYRDGKGLSPLYHSILCSADLTICEQLLNDRAKIGVSDIHGSEEIHQACKLGLSSHLELLILHGANVDSRTASGNTPLHICVLENKINCAQILLRHGADHRILNYAQQSAYDVSVVVCNAEIGELLRKLDPAVKTMNGSVCDQTDAPPPQSISLLVDGESLETDDDAEKQRKASKESLGDLDAPSDSDSDSDEEELLKPEKPVRTFSNAGIGTKRSPAPMKIIPLGTPTLRKRLYASVPGRQFLVINDYEPKHSGELALKKGDLLEVLYIGDNGYWEGHIDGRGGWFPSYCVQEVKHNDNLLPRQLSWFGKKDETNKFVNPCLPTARTVILKRSDKGFGFQLRGANSHVPYIDFVPTPQYPALQYIGDVDKGGVAEKAGLNPGDFVLEINNENVINATHGYAVSLINKGSDKSLHIKVISVAPDSVSSEIVVATNTSKNILEVREKDSKDGRSIDNEKKGPPTPPMRSFSTTLSLPHRGGYSDSSFLAEGSVATTAETVTLNKIPVARKPSVKGIWSGNAFRLQGTDVKIREDDISRGMSRKQKAVSTIESDDPNSLIRRSCIDLTFPNDFKRNLHNCNNISSNGPSIFRHATMSHPPSARLPLPVIVTDPSKFSSAAADKLPTYEAITTEAPPPPDYDTAIENLRQGRSNSLGKGDGVRISRSHTIDRNNYDRGMSRHNGNINSINSSSNSNGSVIHNQHDLENQQYATVRRHNQAKQGIHRSHSMQSSMNGYKPPPSTNLDTQLKHSKALQQKVVVPTREDMLQGENRFNPAEYDTIISQQIPKEEKLYPESDGLVRLQNQRVTARPEIPAKPVSLHEPNRNDSSSCASIDSTYSKDSGYAPSEPDHNVHSVNRLPSSSDEEVKLNKPTDERPEQTYTNSSLSNVEDTATSFLDVVIADAEASFNYEIISPASSSANSQNDIESCSSDSNSVLFSPNSSADCSGHTAVEFPPPPEFLEDEEVSKDSEERITTHLRNNEAPVLSDPPPPYTPYGSDSLPVTSPILNVPNTLQTKSYIEWTCDDVCVWLEHLSLGQYRDTFIDNDIEGKHLAELTKDELKELGVNKLGHRMTLDDAIAKLCRGNPP